MRLTRAHVVFYFRSHFFLFIRWWIYERWGKPRSAPRGVRPRLSVSAVGGQEEEQGLTLGGLVI